MQREAKELSRFLLKPIFAVTAVAASPFLALAFLFVLLGKPLVWSLIPLVVALLLFVAALLVWLVVRKRLVAVAEGIDRVVDIDILRPPP